MPQSGSDEQMVRLITEVAALSSYVGRSTILLDRIDGKMDTVAIDVAAIKQARVDDVRRIADLEARSKDLEKQFVEMDKTHVKHSVKLAAIVSFLSLVAAALFEPIKTLFVHR
jgi:hypothetical protein